MSINEVIAKYGPIQVVEMDAFVVMCVPIMNGVAVGIGGTLDLAIEDLGKDLTAGKTKGFRSVIKADNKSKRR